jgi:hypothetical protein
MSQCCKNAAPLWKNAAKMLQICRTLNSGADLSRDISAASATWPPFRRIFPHIADMSAAMQHPQHFCDMAGRP